QKQRESEIKINTCYYLTLCPLPEFCNLLPLSHLLILRFSFSPEYPRRGSHRGHLMASANQFHSTSLPMDNHSVTPTTATTGLVFPANYGVKPEAALVMDWSPQEQYVLEKGLAKLKDEPKVSKYVKISAALPDKTVRDVALRCRWMTRKRRKRAETSAERSISNIKVVDTSPELNMLANVPQQNAVYVMNNMRHSTHIPFEGPSDEVMDLLQQNAQAFSQISYNLSAYKLQDNISLFCLARNNISAILTEYVDLIADISFHN
ncbi:unnamed protein product, partial [Brassica oleracea var. botrytis]